MALVVLCACGGGDDFTASRRALGWGFGAEIGTGEPVLGPAAGEQGGPAAVCAEGGGLVVWQDARTSVFMDVVGARLDAAGAIVDATGLPLVSAPGDQVGARVAAGAGIFLLVWMELPADLVATEVFALRIAADGTPLDDEPIAIATGSSSGRPAVAWTGDRFVVVYEDLAGLRARTVAPDGAVGDVATLSAAGITPDVACDASGCVVVWSEARALSGLDVYARRLDLTGAVAGDEAALTTAVKTQSAPRIATDGAGYLVVWSDARNGPRDVYGARLGATLVPEEVAVATSPLAESDPVIAAEPGGGFAVVWSMTDGLHGAAVPPAGPAGPAVPLTSAPAVPSSPAIFTCGGQVRVAWRDVRHLASDVYLDDALVSAAAPTQRAVSAAAGPGGWLLAWEEAGIRAARLGPGGDLLGSLTLAEGKHQAPRLARVAGGWWVVWTERTKVPRVLARFVDDDGTAGAEHILGDGDGPAIAGHGADAVAVWHQDRGSLDIAARRLDRDGPVGDTILVTETAGPEVYPAVTATAGRWFIAWLEDGGVRGTHLTAHGSVVDATGRLVSHAPATLAAAPDGAGAVIAWSARDATGSRVLVAARVVGDEVAEVVSLVGGPGERRLGGLATGPEGFALTWEDGAAVYAARIGWDLVVDETLLVHDDATRFALALGDGRTLVAYDRFDFAPGQGARRVRARLTQPTAPATPDAGPPDAAPAPPVEPTDLPTACGCSVGGRPSSPLAPLLLLLAAFRWRRRS